MKGNVRAMKGNVKAMKENVNAVMGREAVKGDTMGFCSTVR